MRKYLGFLLLQIKASVNRHTNNSCKGPTDTDYARIGSKEIIVSQEDNAGLKLPKNNMRDRRCRTVNYKEKIHEGTCQ